MAPPTKNGRNEKEKMHQTQFNFSKYDQMQFNETNHINPMSNQKMM